ncbi:MAG: CocE/NonD family hydrolase [Mycobacteriaceae bacterium]|nr:CocE/NonD family hydrolase [Mycobacteriaceae bacterium]
MGVRVRAGVVALCVGLLLGACSDGARESKPAGAQEWPPAGGRGPCTTEKQADVPATMRDGTVLRADVFRPRTGDAVPVILMRTQYGKAEAQVSPMRYQSPDWFASHCYLVVVQDIRGMGQSAGTFVEYAPDLDDGYDSVEWAAALPGSNGKVGMYGSSYVGATQWLAAIRTPPHLATIVPANTSSDYYDGWTYEGGAFRLAFVTPWAGGLAAAAAQNRGDQETARQLAAARGEISRWTKYTPYREIPVLQPGNPAVAPWYFDWLAHSTRDAYWRQWSIRENYPKVTVPVLHLEGWYDSFLAGGIENFAGMTAHGGTDSARGNQRLVIGPWDHLAWGRPQSLAPPRLRGLGPVGDSPVNELMLAWFDHFLKGRNNAVSGKPAVNYFVMGANRWKSASAWPLPNTRWTEYYLTGSSGLAHPGTLSSAAPPPGAPPNRYRYDPADPAPSLGGHSCCLAAGGPQGPYDQSPVEQRSDVLIFDTPPLTAATELTGPTTVTLWASSSAPDTDFVARLEAVAPDGTAINLNNGIIRAAFRDSLAEPTPIVAGQPYKFTIRIWPTSYLVPAGSRIRIALSSSDYPQYAPNPNTGEPFGSSTRTQPAVQTIYVDAAHPSSVTLPVIPAADPGAPTFPMSVP